MLIKLPQISLNNNPLDELLTNTVMSQTPNLLPGRELCDKSK